MNSNQFSNQLDVAMGAANLLDVPVQVVDEDGFVHEVHSIVFDPEENRMFIRTAWKDNE